MVSRRYRRSAPSFVGAAAKAQWEAGQGETAAAICETPTAPPAVPGAYSHGRLQLAKTSSPSSQGISSSTAVAAASPPALFALECPVMSQAAETHAELAIYKARAAAAEAALRREREAADALRREIAAQRQCAAACSEAGPQAMDRCACQAAEERSQGGPPCIWGEPISLVAPGSEGIVYEVPSVAGTPDTVLKVYKHPVVHGGEQHGAEAAERLHQAVKAYWNGRDDHGWAMHLALIEESSIINCSCGGHPAHTYPAFSGDLQLVYDDTFPCRIGVALWILRCLVRGLFILHEAGQAAGDIKPDNILVKLQNGGIANVALADLGLGGTVAWGAPERCDADSAWEDRRAGDVYAACLVALDFLVSHQGATGAPPPMRNEDDIMDTLRCLEVPDCIAAAATRIIGAGLDEDPARRPAAADLLLMIDAEEAACRAVGEVLVTAPDAEPDPTAGSTLGEAAGVTELSEVDSAGGHADDEPWP